MADTPFLYKKIDELAGYKSFLSRLRDVLSENSLTFVAELTSLSSVELLGRGLLGRKEYNQLNKSLRLGGYELGSTYQAGVENTFDTEFRKLPPEEKLEQIKKLFPNPEDRAPILEESTKKQPSGTNIDQAACITQDEIFDGLKGKLSEDFLKAILNSPSFKDAKKEAVAILNKAANQEIEKLTNGQATPALTRN